MGKPQLEKTREKYVFSYIGKDKKKKYAYRYRHTRGDGTRKEFYQQGFNTQRDAAIALADLKVELLKGNYGKVDHKNLTMHELFQMYIEYQKNNVKPETLRQITFALKKASSVIGDLTINEINIFLYQKKFLTPLSEELAPITLKRYHSRVCSALNFAVKNEFLDRNRITGVKIATESRKRVFSDAEMREIFEFARKKRAYMYNIISFIAATGVRAGEALALKWCDIDLEEGYVDIKRGMSRHQLSTPKTKNSYRKIPLTQTVIKELKKYKAQHKALLMKKGIAASALHGEQFEDRFAFHSITGRQMRYDSIKDFFVSVRKHLGIEEATAHVMRHTYASVLISEGVDVATVASLLGDSVDTVLKTYVHAVGNKKEEAVSKLDKIMTRY